MRGARFFVQTLFFLALPAVLFVSCADSAPKVVTATGSVVLDYADTDSLPSARMAVFVQTESEAQRADSLLTVNRQSGYNWLVTTPQMIQNGDRQWACYTNLQPPEDARIPTGEYDFQYVDAAGEEAWGTFTISYPEALLETKAEDIRSVITSFLDDTVALYDSYGTLIFFGKPKSTWHANENILRDYNTAVTLRHCLATNNNRVVCLLPAEYLVEQEAEPTEETEAEATNE